ncbi:hypothetical protein TrST_g10928 [Triparma strigata]|uniref:Uncharacterized protein n=1 Tax=Triparma strigata TaxID=1606541 RepID=A0A9W7B6T4_9STRA|nr:hypothetical protein TrST_g10928 [Triparma strigata]
MYLPLSVVTALWLFSAVHSASTATDCNTETNENWKTLVCSETADNVDTNCFFKEKQQPLTVRVAKEMITMAVRARRIQLTLNEGYGDRDLLGMVDSLDLAVASFYNRVVDEVDHVTAVVEGWSFIEEDVWPGLAKTREEIKRYIHGNICQQVLDG